MHTNKLELVSTEAVGLSALGRRREKHWYGGWLLFGDSAYEPSVSADCRRKKLTFSCPPQATAEMAS